MDDRDKTKEEIIRNWCLRKLANFITYVGLICTLGVPVLAFTVPERLWLMTLFAFLAGLSDILDGTIAKLLKTTTLFGSAFDKLRDKVFVVPNLIILIWVYRWALKDLPFWLFASTIILACSISFLELLLFVFAWIVAVKKIPTEANTLGRIKTDLLFSIIILWLFSLAIQTSFKIPAFQFSIYLINAVLGITGFLTVLSLENYYETYYLKPGKKNQKAQ